MNQTSVVESIAELRTQVRAARDQQQQISLVPTMGALHAGHLSLMQAARKRCDFVVVSIFVNPTQFAPHEDFDQYPRPLVNDIELCRSENVAIVFHPAATEIYTPNHATSVEVEGCSNLLEGAFRPAHFRGVTTVVLKLLNMVQPDIAFFGQKDYQQQLLIQQMCNDLNVPIEIVTCPTVREADGLALSSRNRYLSNAERNSALKLQTALQLSAKLVLQGETDISTIEAAMKKLLTADSQIQFDYATLRHSDTLAVIEQTIPKMVALIAAKVGETRLIDNMMINKF